MECRPITIDSITIVEATGAQQDVLVDWALEEPTTTPPRLQDPYGAVLWPAAKVLARHLTHSYAVEGRTVWEIGVGTGLVSLAAARAGAAKVYATDYEEIPLQLLRYAAEHLNNNGDDEFNADVIVTSQWDVCNCDDQPLPKDADLLVVADLLYEPRTGRALAKLVVRALRAGMEVVIADSPGRVGRESFLETLQPYLRNDNVAFRQVMGTTVTGERNDLICGRTSRTVSETERPLSVDMLELKPSALSE